MTTKKLAKQIIELRKLDSRQRLFAIEYANSNSVYHAAKAVEITIAEGYKWLQLAGVREFVKEIRQQFEYESIITKGTIESLWLEALPKLMGDEPVDFVDKDGNQTSGNVFHAAPLVTLLKDMRAYATEQEQAGEDDAAPPLNITFEVKPAKKHSRVTKGEVQNVAD